MKKDLRGYGRGEQRPNYESMAQNAMNSANPEQLKSMEDAMNYYGGKSEGELMEERMQKQRHDRRSEAERRCGTHSANAHAGAAFAAERGHGKAEAIKNALLRG